MGDRFLFTHNSFLQPESSVNNLTVSFAKYFIIYAIHHMIFEGI